MGTIQRKLAACVYEKRCTDGVNLIDAAKAIGNISPATLSRIENQMGDTSVTRYVAICRWLDIDPGEMLR